jgi:hypothetical protein
LADFAELLAMDKRSTSAREIVGYLNQLDDNQDNIGCEDNEAETIDGMDEVMGELDRRIKACGAGSPFTMDLAGSVLRHDDALQDGRAIIYRYLLLATRLNMTASKVHAGLDGTALFEELSAEVIRNYLGGRARSLVFGTAVRGGFPERVADLCRQLCEGGDFQNPDTASVDENDGGLDTVSWIPFSDGGRGQLVVFGQCKTGTHWQEHTGRLRPSDFTKLWMSDPPLIDPIRAFFIAESADQGHWRKYVTYAGLLFDRCRLVDYCGAISTDLLKKIQTWTDAAFASVNISESSRKKTKKESRKAVRKNKPG